MKKKTNRYGKTRSLISLGIGVIRGNVSFSIGLAVMFIITTALCVTIVTNPQTIRNSLEVFEDEYVHPDAWFATGLVPEDTYSSIDVDAVEDVETSVSFDTNVKFNDVLYFLRAISIKDGFRQYYHVEDDFDSAPSGMPKVWMTVYFAKANGIHAGDIISVQSIGGYIDAYVESLVSMPECMVCCRNVFSWHDSSDFGYILIPDEYLSDFNVITGMANYWSFKFEKGLTDSERSDTYARLSEKIGDNAVFSELYENSVMKNDIEDELFKIETLCSILPSVTIVIGLMFAFLFINQVMQRQRKTIGMLRALGQSSAQVLAVFIIYILIVSVCSMIIGGGIGIIIVKSTCSVFRDRYSLPRIVTRTDPVKLIFLLFLIFLLPACREVPTWERNEPEVVLSGFLIASDAMDTEAMWEYLSEDSQTKLKNKAEEFNKTVPERGRHEPHQMIRTFHVISSTREFKKLETVSSDKHKATVNIVMHEGDAIPVTLIREEKRWAIELPFQTGE